MIEWVALISSRLAHDEFQARPTQVPLLQNIFRSRSAQPQPPLFLFGT